MNRFYISCKVAGVISYNKKNGQNEAFTATSFDERMLLVGWCYKLQQKNERNYNFPHKYAGKN